MGRGSPVDITIGGILKRESVPALLEAIEQQGAGLEWGDLASVPTTEAALLSDLQRGFLELRDDQARDGTMEDLEKRCRTLGLSYDTRADAVAEFDGGIEMWRPGMVAPASYTGSQNGRVLVPLYEMEKCFGSNFKDVWALSKTSIIDSLNQLYGRDIEPMPPFRIVD